MTSLEAGVFSGYASLFGETDLGGDVVAPGAFRASLRQRGAQGVRMLFQHDPAQPIGTWLEIAEDAKGLRVVGKLNLDVARARELAALIRDGALDGLSIGYRTIRSARAPGGARKLLALDLWEISLVTFPMLLGARVGGKRASPARFQESAICDWQRAADSLSLRLAVAQRLVLRYSPEQPRDDRGRWTSGGGLGVEGVQVAAGFGPEQLDMTVQMFTSAFCKGGIKEVLPSHFNDMTIVTVQSLAKNGDAAARTCLNLLGRQRFRK
jgi:hypothetical protein